MNYRPEHSGSWVLWRADYNGWGDSMPVRPLSFWDSISLEMHVPTLLYMYLHALRFHARLSFIFTLILYFFCNFHLLFDQVKILLLVSHTLLILLWTIVELSNLKTDSSLTILFMGIFCNLQTFLKVQQSSLFSCILALMLFGLLHIDLNQILWDGWYHICAL